MKLGRIADGKGARLALIDEQAGLVTRIGGPLATDPNPVLTVIRDGWTAVRLQALADGTQPLAQARFLAPFSTLNRNVLAVGKNYHEHAIEFDRSGFNATSGSASAIPTHPQIFSKATGTLAGPTDDIHFDPAFTASVDYEGEIGVVIGREARRVSKADAWSVVFGFVALNDVTARDLQKSHAQWHLGKSLDGFCPMGPWVGSIDETPPESLTVRTWVNGELRQEAPFTQLIFDVPTLIETLTKAMTLVPGDIIATGTPVGVGIGFTPPKFLQHGDVVRIAVNGLGELENRVRTD
jgi:2-keto-4-pentenoate hydratase/2-oxohepta-3-ene-1,7-dioic acid hydratase in catechol pathway